MRRWSVIGVVAFALTVMALGVADLIVALRLPDSEDKLRGELLGLLVPAAALVAGLLAGTAGLLTFQETRRDNLADRFTKAIDQLGQGDAVDRDIRIGGIYALEQIARDSAQLHGPVMEVLTAFLRDHRPLSPQPGSGAPTARLPADIQAALTVVGRRNPKQDQGPIDLSSTDLVGAALPKPNLQSALLSNANLQGAQLRDADLRGANLGGANLQDANLMVGKLQRAYFDAANLRGALLREANLEDAFLRNAHLEKASLGGANLRGADFTGANLEGVDLYRANLQGAYLSGANLKDAYLSPEQIAAAHTDRTTLLPTSPSDGTDSSTTGSVESEC